MKKFYLKKKNENIDRLIDDLIIEIHSVGTGPEFEILNNRLFIFILLGSLLVVTYYLLNIRLAEMDSNGQ
jgi:hypothetical protein